MSDSTQALNREDILGALPHREPFLFVDRVLERDDAKIVTEWDIRPEFDFLRGHYPHFPVVPGVLLSESLFQAGALLCAQHSEDEIPEGHVPVLTKIGGARFKRMVRPGETVRNEVTLDQRLGTARYMTGRAKVGSETVLRIEFVTALAPSADSEGTAP